MNSVAPLALSPAITRLSALAELDDHDTDALNAASKVVRQISARRLLVAEGQPVTQPNIILSGWACRVQLLADGRQQIASLLLPGDLIGMYRHRKPVTPTAILALTNVSFCPAPPARKGQPSQGLEEAYAVSAALDEVYLLRHITRLGRLSAYERTADWLLEIRDRLRIAGLASGSQFPMPLTQDMIGDALGLTNVHINRTIQAMRRDGTMTLQMGKVTLRDPERLAGLLDYRAAKVTCD